jgi:hypothetical protein
MGRHLRGRWAATSGGGEQGTFMADATREDSASMAHFMRHTCTEAPEVPPHHHGESNLHDISALLRANAEF